MGVAMLDLLDQATFGALWFSAGFLTRELLIWLDRTVIHRDRPGPPTNRTA